MMDSQGDTTVQPTLPTTTTLMTQDFGEPDILDGLIRLHAADPVQHPILAYSQSGEDAAPYSCYTAQDLNGMIDQAVARLGQPVRKPETR